MLLLHLTAALCVVLSCNEMIVHYFCSCTVFEVFLLLFLVFLLRHERLISLCTVSIEMANTMANCVYRIDDQMSTYFSPHSVALYAAMLQLENDP